MFDRVAALRFVPLLRSRFQRSYSSVPEEFKNKISSGPSFSDFISMDSASASSSESSTSSSAQTSAPKRKLSPKPKWIKVDAAGGENYTRLKETLRGLNLSTVCEEAHCPNIGECWGGGTATIMLMGDTCTRGCRFCAVKTSRTPPALDPNEPKNVAEAISKWGLEYVVLTSVDRDDLPDQGSGHFAETVRSLRRLDPKLLIECLTPDFRGDLKAVETVALAGLHVYAHNIETVESLQRVVRDHRAGYRQSLGVLEHAKKVRPDALTKSSIMLGVGEQPEEVRKAMQDLLDVGVDVVTFGQYLRPTKRHMAVQEYVEPAVFEEWRLLGEQMGFRYVASGPLVRSSYKAGEFYIKSVIEERTREFAAASSASASSSQAQAAAV